MAEITKGMLIYKDVFSILGGYDWQAFIMKDDNFENGEDWYYWSKHKILIRGPKDFPSKVGKVYKDIDIDGPGSIPKEIIEDGE